MVSISFTIAGDLSTFDASGFRMFLISRFSAALDVGLQAVAGSVVVFVSLIFDSQGDASGAVNDISTTSVAVIQQGWLNNTVTVESVAAPVMESKLLAAPSPPPPSP